MVTTAEELYYRRYLNDLSGNSGAQGGGAGVISLVSDPLTVADILNPNGGHLDGKKWIWGVETISTPVADPVNTAGYFIGLSSIDSINCLNWSVVGSQNPAKICGGWLIPVDQGIFQTCYGQTQFIQATMVQTTGVAGQGTYSAGLSVMCVPANGVMWHYTFRILTDNKNWSLSRFGNGAVTNLATGGAMTNGDIFRLSADLSVPNQVTLTVTRNASVLTTYTDSSANRLVIGSPALVQNYAAKGSGAPKSEWRTFSCGLGL